jgi:hypothetical protein
MIKLNFKCFVFLISILFLKLDAITSDGKQFIKYATDKEIDVALFAYEKDGATVVEEERFFLGNWSDEEMKLIDKNLDLAVAKKRASFVDAAGLGVSFFDIAFIKDEEGRIRAAKDSKNVNIGSANTYH